MMEFNKQDTIAVLVGGPSAEREISRNTGGAVAEALSSLGCNVVKLELEPKTVAAQLAALKAKAVFNCVHGLYGEDGRLQSILEAAGLPYTGSGVLASAIAMDKAASKRFFIADGISTPACLIFGKADLRDKGACLEKIKAKFSLPVVLKAASQGSSIGVAIVKEEAALAAALEDVSHYSEEVVAEEYIAGKELTVAIMEKEGEPTALPIIMIAPHSGAYDFHSKYTKGATDYLVPAPLREEETAAVQELALRAYRCLGLSGVARIDVLLNAEGTPFVIEANTVPGMTVTSLVPKAAAAVGIDFPALCALILAGAHY